MGRFDHLEVNDWHSGGGGNDPKNPGVMDEDYYLEKANGAFMCEDYERALSFFSRTLQYNINIQEAWLGQVRCLMELGELHEAVTWSERALKQFANSPLILAARAVAECRIGRSAGAIGFSDSSLAQGATPYGWVARGEVLSSVNATNAKACFAKAIELAPKDAEVRAWIGRVYLLRGCHHLAFEAFKQAVQINSDCHVWWFWIGECSVAMGQIDDAGVAYRRCLAICPSFKKAQDAVRELEKRGVLSKTANAVKRLFTGRHTNRSR